jgi:hypothetical protein
MGFLLVPVLVKGQLLKRLPPLLHREVSVATVRTNPFALSFTLGGFLVKDKDGTPLMGWDRLYVNLSTQTLFRVTPVFQEIRLEGFHAHLALDKAGNPTFADLLTPSPEPSKPAGPPPEIRIQRLDVVGARVEFVDHQPSQPFATTLGPLDLSLDAFALRHDNRNPYSFSGRTERGETFGWRGQFLVEPVRSQGTFYVGHLYLPKYAPFYRDDVAFDLLGGTLDFKASYDFQWGEGRRALLLHGGEAGLDNLSVGERGRPGSAVDLPEVRLRGLEADLLESSAQVASLTLRNGRLNVVRDADGTLNLQRLAALKPSPAKPDAKPFRFDLEELRLENQAVRFQDRVPKHPVDLSLDPIALTVRHLSLDPAKRCDVDLDLRWNGQGRIRAKGQVAPLKSAGGLDLTVEGLDLPPLNGYLEPFKSPLITAGRLGVSGQVDFDLPAARYAFRGQARVDAFKAEDGRELQVAWDALRIGGIKAGTAPLAVSLASIDWDGPAARFTRIAQATPEPQAAPASATPAATPAAAPPKAEIGAFRFKGGSITFLDRTVQPVAAVTLDRIEGQVGRLSSEPGARASMELKARVDGAPLTAKGTVNLLSQAKYSDVALTLEGMDLAPFDPYAGRSLGYGIEKGKLQLDLKYLVEDTRLQGENHIRMDQFTLGEATHSPEAVHLPVKLGLALLRDRHGVIDLDVPVRGDLAQPDFRLGKVIWHAVLNIFGKIATSPFTLIGKAFGGGDADLSLLTFQPGSAVLDEPGIKVLDTLEKGLFERPGLRLDMEATTDEALDGAALRREELEATLARLKGQPLQQSERPRFLRAAYLEAFPAPKDPKSAKAPKDAPAVPEPSAADMEARLLARIPVDAGALRLLEQQRVQAVRTRLLQSKKVGEDRVFLAEGSERAKKEGGCKVFFELK